MSDENLVEYAEKVMKEEGISGRKELQKADYGLYQALRRRKLLDKVGFDEKRRPSGFFSNKSNEELADYAKEFMKKKRISGRGELKKADYGLYETLRKRNLLDRVFEDIEQARQRQADDEVIRMLEEFGSS